MSRGLAFDGSRRTSTTNTTSPTSPAFSDFSSASSASVQSQPIAIIPSSVPSPSFASAASYQRDALFAPASTRSNGSYTEHRSGFSPRLAAPFTLDTANAVAGSSSGDSARHSSRWRDSESSNATGSAVQSGRRITSSPFPTSYYASSPRSPLAGGASFPHDHATHHLDSTSPRRKSAQYPPPSSSFSDQLSSPSSLHPSPKSQRRRSSVSLSTSAGTPFGSFVGTWENSLITGRLSALPSHPLYFLSSIGVLGGVDSPSRLRCPPHLNLSFGAYFYNGAEGSPASSSSPYVGTIDLEAHFMSLVKDHDPSAKSAVPRFPGYRIPRRGQIQLVIKNPNNTAIKLFLIPYDLTGIERSGKGGGKTFLRQKSYVVDDVNGDGKGKLRYAVHLQFCCPPITVGVGGKKAEPHYYLYQTIQVVFASRALDSTEKLRVVAEGPEGLYDDDRSSIMDMQARYAEYKEPGLEWELARKKAKGREKIWELEREKSREVGDADRVDLLDQENDGSGSADEVVHDPDGTSESSYRPRLFPNRPLLSTPPSPPLQLESAPFSLEALTKALPLPTLHPSPLALSFERPTSPAPFALPLGGAHPALTRSGRSLSGLSMSRPGSRASGGKRQDSGESKSP